jgi:probable phosphoglycerate mutase
VPPGAEPGTAGGSRSKREGAAEVVLVRHAETEWSLGGRHTGRTDIPLTAAGRESARGLAPALRQRSFELVLVSPRRRARETCELCGLGGRAQVREDLAEWDYGAYEGLTSPEIQRQRPGWSLWRDGCPEGEDARAVGARADRVVAELRALDGEAIVFSHGHLLRVLGARWIELEPAAGGRLLLDAGAISLLGYEHGLSALARWNVRPD